MQQQQSHCGQSLEDGLHAEMEVGQVVGESYGPYKCRRSEQRPQTDRAKYQHSCEYPKEYGDAPKPGCRDLVRAAEVGHVEQVPSDGEPHEQWYERPGDQECHAPGDNPGHCGSHALHKQVLNTHTLDKEAVGHAGASPEGPCHITFSTVIARLATSTPLAPHDFSIA